MLEKSLVYSEVKGQNATERGDDRRAPGGPENAGQAGGRGQQGHRCGHRKSHLITT